MDSGPALVVLAVLLGGAVATLVRARGPGARGVAYRIGAVLVALVSIVAIVGVTVGALRLGMRQAAPAMASSDRQAADLARGERLAHLCATCHADDGGPLLSGGTTSFSPPLGDLYAPNLTPAGRIATWSDEHLVAAIRHGVDDRGRPLLIMPSDAYAALADADVAALVAYLRSQPAVANDVPPRRLNALGTAVVGLGIFPTSADLARHRRDDAAPTPGAYVAAIAQCADCHGADLSGGDPNGFVPAGPGLRHVGDSWSEDAFVETLRTGITPDGRALDDAVMPWRSIGRAFTDGELRDLHAHLRTTTASTTAEGTTLGARVFDEHCSACHGSDGRGSSGPSLRANRRIADDSDVLRRILDGGRGMPGWSAVLDDDAVAAVATYVRTSWGNDHGTIDPTAVARERQRRD